MFENSCCFIGHRNTTITNDLYVHIALLVEDLIVNHNIKYFLFGSKSKFDDLCYQIVSMFKQKYSNIERVFFPCKNEVCIFENERKQKEMQLEKILKRKCGLKSFEMQASFKTSHSAGIASYVERNKSMIDSSTYCIFHYNPQQKTSGKHSGTKIAFEYAKKRNKNITNSFDIIKNN